MINDDISNDTDDSGDELNLENEINSTDNDEPSSEENISNIDDIKELKGKNRQATKHNVDVKRAIEERADRTKLQKDLDYLFDEEFPNEDEEE